MTYSFHPAPNGWTTAEFVHDPDQPGWQLAPVIGWLVDIERSAEVEADARPVVLDQAGAYASTDTVVLYVFPPGEDPGPEHGLDERAREYAALLDRPDGATTATGATSQVTATRDVAPVAPVALFQGEDGGRP